MTWPAAVERALRDWVRARPTITPLVAPNFVALGATRGTSTSIGIRRVAGAEGASDVPTDDALFQFDCWAETESDAADVRDAVIGVFAGLTTTPFTASVLCTGALVVGQQWLPDPDTDTPRYVVTVRVLLVAT